MARMRLKAIRWIVPLCLILGTFWYFRDVLPHEHRAGTAINIGFSPLQVEEARIREQELEREYNLSAIVLHWQRLDGAKATIEYFLGTRLFQEIVVWNNNPQLTLNISQLLANTDMSIPIRIINSKDNLKDEAKYRACAAATARACFYIDDDWDASHYTRSLVSSFRSDPQLLHAVTDPYTYYTNLIWSYVDETIDLHAGFSWIGCGSIFLRTHAERHLQLLHRYLANDTGTVTVYRS